MDRDPASNGYPLLADQRDLAFAENSTLTTDSDQLDVDRVLDSDNSMTAGVAESCDGNFPDVPPAAITIER